MEFKRILVIIFLGIICIPNIAIAQTENDPPEDDLGNVTDEYQEYFFEALKQKGIENYERAILALRECINIDDTQAVLYFELGKNYVALKNYNNAEEALITAVEKEPDNEWYLDELYGVYIEQNQLDKAIEIVKQLVDYHPDYKQDLASLYVQVEKYDDALQILDELDRVNGVSPSRDAMRNQIYTDTGRDKERIENLESRIASNPDSESNFLNLIYRYSESGDKEKAFETAKQLLVSNPKSQLVHLALYKFYLDAGQEQDAILSMKIVLKSNAIKPDAKYKVLNDFIKFVGQNPDYEKDLLEVTADISESDKGKTNAELGEYYYNSGDKVKALLYYEKALSAEPNNFAALRNVLLLLIDNGNFEKAAKKSTEAIEVYPAQPVLYLINGVAFNNLLKPDEALESLELGLDYIIDDFKMESDFYLQLAEAYKLKNETEKADDYFKRANELLKGN